MCLFTIPATAREFVRVGGGAGGWRGHSPAASAPEVHPGGRGGGAGRGGPRGPRVGPGRRGEQPG